MTQKGLDRFEINFIIHNGLNWSDWIKDIGAILFDAPISRLQLYLQQFVRQQASKAEVVAGKPVDWLTGLLPPAAAVPLEVISLGGRGRGQAGAHSPGPKLTEE